MSAEEISRILGQINQCGTVDEQLRDVVVDYFTRTETNSETGKLGAEYSIYRPSQEECCNRP